MTVGWYVVYEVDGFGRREVGAWASTFSPSAELPGWGRELAVYTDARSWQYSTHLMEIIEVF